MKSERKIRANRANARASTGPQTVRGCARAAQNAFRHGLSLPVCADPALSQEVETLAREIAGTDATAKIQELARRVAEAQIDLHRLRYARHQLLSHALGNSYCDARASVLQKSFMRSFPRPNAREIPMAASEFLIATPQGAENLATVLSQEAKQLLAMDRYERRALSRRMSAIRAFDFEREWASIQERLNSAKGSD